jgi:hypothetical protein
VYIYAVYLTTKKSDLWAYIALLLSAAFLRWWVPGGIPLTSDEISALLRLDSPTFSHLMEHGVAVDGHPPLVQIFLYYYVPICGGSVFLIKLPFVLISVLAVHQMYWLTKQWFGNPVAFWAAGAMAVLPFFMYYGQVARPYGPGLNGTLWMAQMWFFLSKKEQVKRGHWVQWVLAAWICAYSHYFAALQAAFLWLSAGFWWPAQRRLAWGVSGAVMLAGFAPYSPYFLHQLSMGGIGGPEGWLGAPEPRFVWDFLSYLFAFNPWLWGSAGFLALCALYMHSEKTIHLPKSSLWLLLAFIFPLAVGYGYSVWINPVLQPAALLFACPFLLLFLSKGLSSFPKSWGYGFTGIWLAFSVVWTQGFRKHHELMGKEPFKGLSLDAQKQSLDPDTYVALDIPEKRWDFFGGESFDRVHLSPEDSEWGASRNYPRLSVGVFPSSNHDALFRARRSHPYLSHRLDLLGGTRWLWTQHPKEKSIAPRWRYAFDNGTHSFFNTPQEHRLEYSKSLELMAKRHDLEKNDVLFAAFYFRSNETADNVELVSEWYSENDRVHWKSAKAEKLRQQVWVCYLTLPLADVLKSREDLWSVLVWNPSQVMLKAERLYMECWPGNPILYGLHEEI